jgi:hypothetical protein
LREVGMRTGYEAVGGEMVEGVHEEGW